MTAFVRRMATLTGLAILLSVGVAQAQIEEAVEFTTTFPFTVGNATIPAGTYTVVADQDSPTIFELNGAHMGVFFEGQTVETKGPATTEVVFMRYGQAYVLKTVWLEGSSHGIEAVAGEPERHHIKRGDASGDEHVRATKRSKGSKVA